jgi:hypothetical protein
MISIRIFLTLMIFVTSPLQANEEFVPLSDDEAPEQASMSDPDYTTDMADAKPAPIDAIQPIVSNGSSSYFGAQEEQSSNNYTSVGVKAFIDGESNTLYKIGMSYAVGEFTENSGNFSLLNAAGAIEAPLGFSVDASNPLYGGVKASYQSLNSSSGGDDDSFRGHGVFVLGFYVGAHFQWDALGITIEESFGGVFGNIQISDEEKQLDEGEHFSLSTTLTYLGVGVGFSREEHWIKSNQDDVILFQSDYLNISYHHEIN